MKSAWENEWLTVNGEVELTPIIEPVIVLLDECFAEAQHHAKVTSGLRDARQQLLIIQHLAFQHRVADEFPEIETASVDALQLFDHGGQQVQMYEWQRAWSRLLNKGVIVNPPHAARCLFSYLRDGIDKRGQIIGESPHFRGTAFDIGGAGNGVDDEVAIIAKAAAKGIRGLKGYLVERNNNAVHVDCR